MEADLELDFPPSLLRFFLPVDIWRRHGRFYGSRTGKREWLEQTPLKPSKTSSEAGRLD